MRLNALNIEKSVKNRGFMAKDKKNSFTIFLQYGEREKKTRVCGMSTKHK